MLLGTDDLAALCADAGVVDEGATGELLAGGVSNTVVLVSDGRRRVVVKQSLPKLKVTDDWPAKQERILTEAAALRLAGTLRPGAVPAVLHVDPGRFVVVIEAAPTGWRTWKDDLLAGEVGVELAASLGTALGGWHAATVGDPGVVARFDDHEGFDQLRLDPYYRTTAARVAELRAPLGELIESTAATRTCLVHGDFSPKNVLVGDGRSWVLDWEVAHVGDPAFDLGFVTTHLLLKAIHLGRSAADLRAASRALLAAYATAMPIDDGRLVSHVGALVSARVHGKSPVDYLTDVGKRRAGTLGAALLLDPPATIDDVWTTIA